MEKLKVPKFNTVLLPPSLKENCLQTLGTLSVVNLVPITTTNLSPDDVH